MDDNFNYKAKKQKPIKLKDIKFEPNIGDNDLIVKMNSARRILEKGDRVRVTLEFRGRAAQHKEIGEEKLKAFLAHPIINEVGNVELPYKIDGNNYFTQIYPKKKK